MKHLIWPVIFFTGIPIIAVASARNATVRTACWAILVGLLGLGHLGGVVNFISMEHYRGPDRGFEFDFTFMFAIGLLLSRNFRAPRIEPQEKGMAPGFYFLLIFLVWCIIGIAGSIMPLYGAFAEVKWIRMLFLYYVVWSAGRSEADPRVFFNGVRLGFALGMLFVGYFGMTQKFLQHVYRVTATFDAPNTIPLFVNLAAPMVLAWILGDNKIERFDFVLSFLATGMALVAVVTTQSRLGMFLATAIIAATLVASNARKPSRRSIAATLAFVALGLIGGVLVLNTIITRIKTAPESSEQARDEFNVAAKLMAADKFFGVGLNNFSEAMTNVEKYRASTEVMANEEQSGVAHHLWLLTAAETGYVGLGVFVAFFAAIELHYLRFLFKRRTKAERAALGFLPQVVWATLFGNLALITQGFYEWAFRITPVSSQFIVISAFVSAAISRSTWTEGRGLGTCFDKTKPIV
ncbi:MAG: O-antigen ligase family protein [Spirochaetota bacterium]